MDIAKHVKDILDWWEDEQYAESHPGRNRYDEDPDFVVSAKALKELLKTHTLVPNEPVAVVEVWNQGGSGEFVTANGIESLPHGTKLYAQNNS